MFKTVSRKTEIYLPVKLYLIKKLRWRKNLQEVTSGLTNWHPVGRNKGPTNIHVSIKFRVDASLRSRCLPSLHKLQTSSVLLSFTFKCQQLGSPLFYLFISGFSLLISNSRWASSLLCSLSLECLYLPTFFLLFVCSFQVTLMAFYLRIFFDRFSIKVVNFSSIFSLLFSRTQNVTSACVCVLLSDGHASGGGGSPLRHCCFLVTGQRRSLRREMQLQSDGSLTLHLSQLAAWRSSGKQQFPFNSKALSLFCFFLKWSSWERWEKLRHLLRLKEVS